MSMIEKAARAMVAAEQDQWDLPAAEWDRETLERHGIIGLARAVLMAVREPGTKAVRAGCVEIENAEELETDDPRWGDGYDIWIPSAEKAFAAMIDAILGETE